MGYFSLWRDDVDRGLAVEDLGGGIRLARLRHQFCNWYSFSGRSGATIDVGEPVTDCAIAHL